MKKNVSIFPFSDLIIKNNNIIFPFKVQQQIKQNRMKT